MEGENKMSIWTLKRKSKTEPKRKPSFLNEAELNSLIEHPISLEELKEKYSWEFQWTARFFHEYLLLLHLHKDELTKLREKTK